MLSIHYVSVMMCIFYIDWEQYWKCERYQLNSHNTQVTDLTVSRSGFQWHRRDLCIEHVELVLVTRLFHSVSVSQCDCLTVWPFFWTLHVFVVWFFFFVSLCVCLCVCVCVCVCVGGGGALNSNVFTIWWRILISRLPRVFRHFKRRSC